MISKEDLRLAMFYQLAGMIRDEWEDRPEEVETCLAVLDEWDDFIGIDEFDDALVRVLRDLLFLTADWKADNSEQIQLELTIRIKEHEIQQKERDAIPSPGTELCEG